MRHLDLFSGIGGFALAARWMGWETVGFCEIDPFCQKVLRKHWPDVPIHEDVKEFHGEPGQADIITGGFPCQDISVAGKGAGIEAPRSGLWTHLARIIREVRPRFAVVENVANLLSGDDGRWFGAVVGDLAEIGYDTLWNCIPAQAVGAPHRRDRVWIVAHSGHLCGGNDEQGSLGLCGNAWDETAQRSPSVATAARSGEKSEAVDDSMCRRHRAQKGKVRSGGNGSFDASRWNYEPGLGGSPYGFPYWLVRHIGRGLNHVESRRRTKALQELWSDHVAKALWRASRGLERMGKADVLFAFVREYEAGTHEARLLVESAEASEGFLRSLRRNETDTGASPGSGHHEQPAGEHSDSMQVVSRFLALDGPTDWRIGSWEDGLPRVATGIPNRVDRLRGLGNAIVPQVAHLIFQSIEGRETKC